MCYIAGTQPQAPAWSCWLSKVHESTSIRELHAQTQCCSVSVNASHRERAAKTFCLHCAVGGRPRAPNRASCPDSNATSGCANKLPAMLQGKHLGTTIRPRLRAFNPPCCRLSSQASGFLSVAGRRRTHQVPDASIAFPQWPLAAAACRGTVLQMAQLVGWLVDSMHKAERSGEPQSSGQAKLPHIFPSLQRRPIRIDRFPDVPGMLYTHHPCKQPPCARHRAEVHCTPAASQPSHVTLQITANVRCWMSQPVCLTLHLLLKGRAYVGGLMLLRGCIAD